MRGRSTISDRERARRRRGERGLDCAQELLAHRSCESLRATVECLFDSGVDEQSLKTFIHQGVVGISPVGCVYCAFHPESASSDRDYSRDSINVKVVFLRP